MPVTPERAHLIRDLIDWYRAMGVDAALDVEAVDWLATGARVPGEAFLRSIAAPEPAAPGPRREAADLPRVPVHQPPQPAPAASATPVTPPPRSFAAASSAAPDVAETAARASARSASTLETLRAALADFDGCGLKVTAKNLCFFRGVPDARLMIIGEAPGREEDLDGRPFVGRAGQLLDRMLAAIGLTEKDVHITNVVYWRPPGNRTPTPQETAVCKPFLLRQIELVGPAVILTLGGPAAKAVLDVQDGIMKIRGRWRQITIDGAAIPVMPTLHPAYLLRTPAAKRQAWRDLLAVKARLGTAAAASG